MRRLAIAALMVAAACGGSGTPQVVVTTNILGDIVASLGGDVVAVEALLPRGVDPHDYRLSARQAASIADADLVIANGLGLERGMIDVLADADNVLWVADELQLGVPDPHFWLDPLWVAEAGRLIGGELAAFDGSVDWDGRVTRYVMQMRDLHERLLYVLRDVEPRLLVTNHDALGYFAARYRFEVVGTVIPGLATLAEPSSAQLAELTETIVRLDVPAIFVDSTHSSALAEAVASEIGRPVAVVELFTGSLGEPGSGAETLSGLLVTNAERIAEALSG